MGPGDSSEKRVLVCFCVAQGADEVFRRLLHPTLMQHEETIDTNLDKFKDVCCCCELRALLRPFD